MRHLDRTIALGEAQIMLRDRLKRRRALDKQPQLERYMTESLFMGTPARVTRRDLLMFFWAIGLHNSDERRKYEGATAFTREADQQFRHAPHYQRA